MDLSLYARVVWRFRRVIGAGLVLAVVLALLTVFRVSPSGISYRQAETWGSRTTLFVTQPGFPWGRATAQYAPGDSSTGQPSVPVADPARLSSLTGLYARLATSDPVRERLAASERRNGSVRVNAVPAPPYSNPSTLPLLSLNASAPTGPRARDLAENATSSFRDWLGEQQDAARIPPDQRIVVSVVNHASTPALISGRSKTLPIVVFMTVMAAVLALAFVLENTRPQGRPSTNGAVGQNASGLVVAGTRHDS